ncbi:mRNA splicing protein PRP42 KNAG_0A04230 [Huiozyma naganishii CBS 8797]|uniref:Suppressor of forked domain-containing protein n=1 Tax=Huiozyma naganishii (strain ATCC MYA-139 / BCRC 22969 / CBS 8797 / KCTC 17520 / NBRC 10181 / NCYC 3082 / Yp74L-3) TaxID=1071383 RepID=J7QZY8_HUIN7|nr:hypothetical protein KNAG_0A04230 [Kazachstania naganishii CBS 8797]CCK68100.1 hypothetical protein KNAG_0A04230 [Kazachstania naganishii CBS 8797]
MDKYTGIITDAKFSKLALETSNFPKDLNRWERLLNFLIAASGPIDKTLEKQCYELICSTYDSMLSAFPFLENYHVDYALFEYKLGHVERTRRIFQRALSRFNNRSLLIWVFYLQICNKLDTDNKQLFAKYEVAEQYIGMHYLSCEFWEMYLHQLKSRCRSENRYMIVLRKTLELPIHDFSRFYTRWLQRIDSVRDLSELTLFAPREELAQKLKIEVDYPGRRGPYLRECKKQLKKFTKELYMVVQYQVIEMYTLFESKISTQYYTSPQTLIPSDIIENWLKYLDFTEKLHVDPLTHLNYQRALLPLAHYDAVWIRYARWLIEEKCDLVTAKNVLVQGLQLCNRKTGILNHLYALLVKMNELSLLDGVLKQTEALFDNSVEVLKDFEVFWDYIQYELFLQRSVTQKNSRYGGADDSSNEFIPGKLLGRIKAWLDLGDSRTGQTEILSMLIGLQTKGNTQVIEQVFNYLLKESAAREFYHNSSFFWRYYCLLVFHDLSKSYLERRTSLIESVWSQVPKANKEVVATLHDFCESYIPEEIDTLRGMFGL